MVNREKLNSLESGEENPPLFYTTGEAAKICRVSQKTIVKCFDKGVLKGFRISISRIRRISHKSLVDCMLENRIPLKWLEEYVKIKKKSSKSL